MLFLTVRADFGGGPEHLWWLLQNMPEEITAYVACPHEYPYYERYRQLVGDSNITELPHRTFSIASLWRLRAFCKEKGISILHSHGKGAGLYSRLLALLTGVPCVHTFHGVHMDGYRPGKRAVYRLYERVMSLLTQMGIAVSEGELNQIVERGLMPRRKLHLIPNGVMIPDTRDRGDVFTAPPPYTIVTFSRFDYQKNSPFLLDILNALKDIGRLDDFRLTAVGDGTDRQGMLDAVQGTALEDTLCCPGASETPHSFFDGALCYLSTSRWEGMPLSVIEAMAHGLPAIASDVVGNRDVVRDGETGFLYPEGNAVAAANLLCRLADDPDLRQTLGAAARNYVIANHDVRIMAKETFKILHDVAMP
ncbi:Glycosyl transferase family 2 (fragment) [uncultured delta proteobacterium]|uniref:Glycosyl transferase family 2 n=1 Tax=uncultured delta proteobacterium TaxID=34034 RepID=A0A212KHC0_9DELT